MIIISNTWKPFKFKPYFETFLSNDCGEFSTEIQKYVADSELPLPEETERLDIWWNKVFKTKRYPVLSSLVRPCLSILMGPMVECSFSVMNDIDSRSGLMEIDTYSAIVTTEYNIKSTGKSAAIKYNFGFWYYCP